MHGNCASCGCQPCLCFRLPVASLVGENGQYASGPANILINDGEVNNLGDLHLSSGMNFASIHSGVSNSMDVQHVPIPNDLQGSSGFSGIIANEFFAQACPQNLNVDGNGANAILPSFSFQQHSDYESEMFNTNMDANMLERTLGDINTSSSTPNISVFPDYSDDTTLFKSDSDLPNPNLFNHLIDVFFDHYLQLARMFECTPTELKFSVFLPPSHPDRPHPALLHAICAAASIYTDKVPPSRLPFYGRVPSDQIFPEPLKKMLNLPDSFGEHHIRLAFKHINEWRHGEKMPLPIDIVQTLMVISATNRRLAKWGAAYACMDGAMRFACFIHLNVGPGFEGFAYDYIPHVRPPPPQSSKQEEARRNTFWMCYVTERVYARLPNHAMGVDDCDVTQALPLRCDLFEQGVQVIPNSKRQYAHSPDVLSNHPPELTDSFVLFVKSAILISRVRTFNRRFRKLNSLELPGMFTNKSSPQDSDSPTSSSEDSSSPSSGGSRREKTPDAREVEAFQKLEIEVDSFTNSFPGYLQEPVSQDGSVDWTLLNAYLATDYAKMTLHEPHADLRLNESEYEYNDFACKSTRKVVEAIDHAYHLLRTMAESVPDVTLSDPYCTSQVFQSAAIYLEIIQKSFTKPPSSEEEIIARPRIKKFWDKFDYLRSILKKIGARLPQAEVLNLLLDDLLRRIMNPDRRNARISIP